ncbi:MAG: 6-phosphogluconate dehydrogenase, decarboxylating, partial [uncultured Thermoleophilia bacterium]
PSRARRGTGRLAACGRDGCRARRAGARLLVVARLLRRVPTRAPPREPDPGPARPVRRAHVSSRRPRRRLPHVLGRGRAGGGGRAGGSARGRDQGRHGRRL